MNVKLINNVETGIIPACKLEHGQIGVIVSWRNNLNYIGKIVQKSKIKDYNGRFSLDVIGGPRLDYWARIDALPEDCKVRVLQPGEQMEIC